MRVLKESHPKDEKLARSLIETASKVLNSESRAVADLIDRLDDTFVAVIHELEKCTGHLVVTGMGKSGLIGNKIASTFSLIGLPALFLHSGDASHGDLGILTRGDIVIAISYSGETEEILKLLPTFSRIKCPLVALTGNTNSTLAKRSDYVLDIGVREEPGPQGIVPTASTAATLAMGDALAMAFLEIRGFKEEDFARRHPGGTLGNKILCTVAELMHIGDEIPSVKEDSNISEVIKEMSRKLLGTTLVVDAKGQLKGIITDGDLRRLIEKKKDVSATKACELMGMAPKTIRKDKLAAEAVRIMEENSITSLVVSENGKNIDGIIHLHDLLKAGIV